MGKTHHDARALTDEEARQLYDHIRAVEALNDEIKDIQDDRNERITLCCEQLPINKDVFQFVIKRRKAGKSTCGNFDQMLELVEEAVQTVEQQRRNAGPAPVRSYGARSDAAEDEEESQDVEPVEEEEDEFERSVRDPDDEDDTADDAPPFEPDDPDSIEEPAGRQRELMDDPF